MTSVFTTQPSAGFVLGSPQDDLATDRDAIEPMLVSNDIISTPDCRINGSENYLNRFYMELMGDQLGPSLDKFSVPGESDERYSPKATRNEREVEEDTIPLGGLHLYSQPEKRRNENGPESFNKYQGSGTFCATRNVQNDTDQLLIKDGKDCSFSPHKHVQVAGLLNETPDIPTTVSSISKVPQEQNSLTTELTPRTGEEQSGCVNKRFIHIQSSDEGQGSSKDRGCSPYTLSVIVEEDEDASHDSSHNCEHPWSQLLTNGSSHSAQESQHKQNLQTPLNIDSVDKPTADPATIDVLTLVKNCNVEDGTDGNIMFPLFDMRTKMTRSQTLQVAALMAVGIILVTGILVWVFSPVILGMW